MRYLLGFMCVCALGVMPLLGCSETAGAGGSGGVAGTGGVGGEVIDAIEEMMVGRWWLDWDKSAANTADGIGLATFTADGWANYDVEFPTIPGVTEWCRRYADWSLFDVVSETEFGYALTYTHDTCIREAGQAEQFKVVLDQMDPPKGDVTRLAAGYPAASGEWTLPIERCTTDITASEACGFETGLGPPMQNPSGTGGAGGDGGSSGSGGMGGEGGSAGDSGSGGGIAPSVDFVSWNWVDPCDINASGQGLVVTIYASDPDTPPEQLTYSGQVQDCTGDLNAMQTTLSCEVYLGARQSEATATDPQGNQDTLLFGPDPCTDGCEGTCPKLAN